MVDWAGTGMSVMETSHRSKEYDAVHYEAMDLMKELLGLDDDHQVLFLQGGASTQFAMIPMNFIPKGGSADFVDTGTWSTKAIKEANIIAVVRVAEARARPTASPGSPADEYWTWTPNAAYVHITSNNTIKGTQYHDFPDTGDTPGGRHVVGHPVASVRRQPFSLIYAGAQKNIGPSGVTIVIIKKSWLEQANENVPTMLATRPTRPSRLAVQHPADVRHLHGAQRARAG
jgi:phosphoserine aminotransferase